LLFSYTYLLYNQHSHSFPTRRSSDLEIMYPSVLSESVIKLNMGLLLIELIKNIDKVQDIKQEATHQYLLIKSLEYIEENYKTGTLSELAKELNQSNYSMSKYIKEATHLTFKELLQEKRLSKAKDLDRKSVV